MSQYVRVPAGGMDQADRRRRSATKRLSGGHGDGAERAAKRRQALGDISNSIAPPAAAAAMIKPSAAAYGQFEAGQEPQLGAVRERVVAPAPERPDAFVAMRVLADAAGAEDADVDVNDDDLVNIMTDIVADNPGAGEEEEEEEEVKQPQHHPQQQQQQQRGPVVFEVVHWPRPEFEYANDAYEHLLAGEQKYQPNPHMWVKTQESSKVNWRSRAILLDWLSELAFEFTLELQTLLLAVKYVDVFMCTQRVSASKLQLLGATAVLLASKMEEIYPPTIADLVEVGDGAYTRTQVLELEKIVLFKLQFSLTMPTALDFYERYVAAEETDRRTVLLGRYLMERYMQEPNALAVRPSAVAASAIFLSRITIGAAPWTQRLAQAYGRDAEALAPLVKDMHRMHRKAGGHSLKAVFTKYSHRNNMGVALIEPLPDIRTK